MNLAFDEGEKGDIELSKGQQMKEPLLPGPKFKSQKSETITMNQEVNSKLKKQETKIPENKITEKKKSSKKNKGLCFRFFQWFKACIGLNKIQKDNRIIYFKGNKAVEPTNYYKNIVRNQKYNFITFLPLVLFNQFKYFFNMFFLVIGLSQFYEPLRVGFTFTYIAPLAFVIFISMVKELFDDYERYQKDKEANSFRYCVLSRKEKIWQMKKSSELKVGDIVRVLPNQRIPADMILLYTIEESGTVFIRTDQLDGETDWKLRTPINQSQNFFSQLHENSFSETLTMDWQIKASAPIGEIYKFEGVFKDRNTKIKESLSLDQTLWANCVLASAEIIGIVIYTGKETRMQMNSQKPRTKMGRLDHSLNSLSKFLFLFLTFLSVIMVILHGINFRNFAPLLLLFRYILLLSSIIPISMRVNLDVAKVIYSRNIALDKEIPGTIARNRVIPEELGLIRYLLSDKTGTLTRNEMIFKKISLETDRYTYEQTDLIKKMLVRATKGDSNCPEVIKENNSNLPSSQNIQSINTENQSSELGQSNKMSQFTSSLPLSEISQVQTNKSLLNSNLKKKKRTGKKKKNSEHDNSTNIRSSKIRHKEQIIKDVVNCMALCNNVTPIYTDGVKSFQASSPDEVALVNKAEEFGVELIERTQKKITVRNALGGFESYIIRANFPFSSERKRMGIVLQHESTNDIVFYLKGADIVMKDMLMEVKRGYLLDECDNLSKEGLRTLVLTQKVISLNDFIEWEKEYIKAQNSMFKREENIAKVISILEKNMDYLGVAGVEDKLQEDISKSVENLRNAGIKIWVLTGDKAETAKCIAISAGIKETNQEIFEILNMTNSDEIINKIEELSDIVKSRKMVLLIDGITLTTIFEHLTSKFFIVAKEVSAVICARCAPTQKAKITKVLKAYSTNGQVAAIGDGGNDVGMIQEADVGVGIVGKEGMQAALASDFSIEKFKYLEGLLLWHGRLSYKRSAALSQFVIHRGLIISVLQTVFTCSFYYVAIPIYNGWLMLGYSTIYTTLPVFSLIFDEDVDRQSAMDFPTLYDSLQNGRHLSIKTLLSWIWKSLYQGAVIYLVSIYIFDKVFLNIVTITFSSLILTEYLNIFSEINKISTVMIVAQVLSAIMYFASILFLNRIFDVTFIDLEFLLKSIIITLISWLPLHLFKLLMKKLDPTDYEKVRETLPVRKKKEALKEIKAL